MSATCPTFADLAMSLDRESPQKWLYTLVGGHEIPPGSPTRIHAPVSVSNQIGLMKPDSITMMCARTAAGSLVQKLCLLGFRSLYVLWASTPRAVGQRTYGARSRTKKAHGGFQACGFSCPLWGHWRDLVLGRRGS